MALEILSGAVYHDTAKNIPKQHTDGGTQESGSATNIKITEVPGGGISAGSTQKEKDSGNGKNQNGTTNQQIKQAIDRANHKMKAHRTRCEFSYDEETKRVSITVYDKDTEEVIKEIPPEETLEMVQKMWELAGILIDEKR